MTQHRIKAEAQRCEKGKSHGEKSRSRFQGNAEQQTRCAKYQSQKLVLRDLLFAEKHGKQQGENGGRGKDNGNQRRIRRFFYRYLQNNGIKVQLEAIDKPDKVFADKKAPLAATLEHEMYVTSLINDIYAAAYEARDFRSMQFLDWFVKEQGEEEKNANDLIAKMELFGDDAKGLYMLNSELGARVYSAPSLVL